jgi:nucleotide-binding universal stress UspA family protein
MKRILVPCDFSKPAELAFQLALDIAQRSGGTVHLLNIIEFPIFQDPMMMPVLNLEEQFLKELREMAESRFKTLITEKGRTSVPMLTDVQLGVVCPVILEYIQEKSIDIVVMGSHGASGLNEFFIGSNAQKIVQKAIVPVLILKNLQPSPIRNIVFPNTLELDHQDDLTMKVKSLQDFFDAHIHIVWINTPLNFTADSITNRRLDSFAKKFQFRDYTTHIFNHPREEEGIQEFTRIVQGDLIAMGTHGRKGLSHIVNGSLAEDVVNHTDKMVWTYTLRNEAISV